MAYLLPGGRACLFTLSSQGTLKGLGLTAVEVCLESLLEQAAKKEPSYADFLLDLLKSELEARPGEHGICELDCSSHTCPM